MGDGASIFGGVRANAGGMGTICGVVQGEFLSEGTHVRPRAGINSVEARREKCD